MGRLVRRYIRCYDLTVKNKMTVGTDASPLAIATASQIMIEGAQAVSVAGTSEGVKGDVEANLTSGVLNMVGVHGKTSVPTGKNTGGGYQYGIYVENEVLGNAVFAGGLEGIRIEQYTESGITATGQIVYAIHIANSIGKAPSKYYFMRMSEDGIGNLDAIFFITKGATCPDMKYLFEINYGAAIGMVTTVGACTVEAGYLKIRCNAVDRYIQLWTTPP